jgi:hypothetical protein
MQIDGCRYADVFAPEKIFQFGAQRFGDVDGREPVHFFVELVLLAFGSEILPRVPKTVAETDQRPIED